MAGIKKIKFILIFFSLSFITNFLPQAGFCQGTPPLFTFFQNKYDSTIIFYPYSTWDMSANYFILAKKENKAYAFRYNRPWNRRVKYSRDTLAVVWHEDSIFRNSPIDSNKFLLKILPGLTDLDSIWKFFISNNIYTLRDDSDFGEGCSKVDPKTRCYIFDSINYVFWLIDKKNKRGISYYDPKYFETKCCPGVQERQIILKIISVMKPIFPD